MSVLVERSKRVTPPPPSFPPAWAIGWGVDRYGLYAELELAGVVQRMRWIGPGTFLMGSPKDEPERYDNELQHEVTLTKGFWLADTACTQELWEALMGSNPSAFTGPDLPVETVSWDDVHGFLEKANGMLSEAEMHLPTEAQWEYACRAGTETPFWFGETITTDQVNFDENYPHGQGKEGERRRGTVGVKELPCNGLGLYQMHGNVWEWCQDWYGDYSSEPAVDPVGPSKGADRVVRGGCWRWSARYARSACRFSHVPGGRDPLLGFRFARDQ